MREYQQKDIQACFESKRLVFVGDSTTRQVFWAVAQKLDRKKADKGIADMQRIRNRKHMDLEFFAHRVVLQFVWDPWLNGTRLKKELNDFSAVPKQVGKAKDAKAKDAKAKDAKAKDAKAKDAKAKDAKVRFASSRQVLRGLTANGL
jgi:hypothetical protein